MTKFTKTTTIPAQYVGVRGFEMLRRRYLLEKAVEHIATKIVDRGPHRLEISIDYRPADPSRREPQGGCPMIVVCELDPVAIRPRLWVEEPPAANEYPGPIMATPEPETIPLHDAAPPRPFLGPALEAAGPERRKILRRAFRENLRRAAAIIRGEIEEPTPSPLQRVGAALATEWRKTETDAWMVPYQA